MKGADRSPRPLSAILEDERNALISGNFTALAALAAEREAALPAALLADPDGLAVIRRLAERNRRLAAAATSGLSDARARFMAALGADDLETYSAGGKRRKLAESRPKIQRRA